MANKIITADTLEYFKGKQDTYNALTYLAQIVYPTLPTTYNYEGRLAYPIDEGRLYIYSETNGWQKFAMYSDIPANCGVAYDSDGNIAPVDL